MNIFIMLNVLTLWTSHVVQAIKISLMSTALTFGGAVGHRLQVCL